VKPEYNSITTLAVETWNQENDPKARLRLEIDLKQLASLLASENLSPTEFSQILEMLIIVKSMPSTRF